MSSLRLAYKDLEIQMKKDEKMNMSGKKKAESERLGMGFGNSCPKFFPASGSFPVSWLFTSGGKSIGASPSVFPMNIQC